MTDLSISDMAKAAGITRKHARRVVSEIRDGKRVFWRKATPRLIDSEPPSLDFQSLPIDVREAVMMWDQMPLPLTPPFAPMTTIILTDTI